MKFSLTFHTPFRVASGHAGDGSDTTVDPAALLPASSLKGVMRSAAWDLLRFPEAVVDEVFGTGWQPSPWSWSDAQLSRAGEDNPCIRPRARIQIQSDTSTVTEGALLVADEVLADRGEFIIEQTGWVSRTAVGQHETVLLAAARAVTALGGNRRRGLGWVTVTPVEPSWSATYLEAAAQLAGGRGDA